MSAQGQVTDVSFDAYPPVSAGPPVYEDRGDEVWLSNGRVELLIYKNSASVKSLIFDGRELLAPHRRPGRGEGYIQVYSTGGYRNMQPDRVDVERGPGLIDVGFLQRNEQMPFPIEVHYVMRDGIPGFYGYAVLTYDHDHFLSYVQAHQRKHAGTPRDLPDDALAYMEQLNFCFFLDDQLFTLEQVDDLRHRRLRSKKQADAEKVMDATFREPDGRLYTKYDLTYLNENHLLHGVMGHGFGAWVMQGSGEHLNGGPTAQELSTEHAILLQHFNGAHFGSGKLEFTPDENGWTKLAGPFLFYFNRGVDQGKLWGDAKLTAQRFVDAAPHPWMLHRQYSHRRGVVTGRLRFADGEPAVNALVFLAQPPGGHHPEWQQQGKDFFFWDRTDDQGRFAISKARANEYSLYAIDDGVFGEFRHDGVVVEAGMTNDLGDVVWEPEVNGRIIWQIGTPDRDAGEFALGEGRSWGRWRQVHPMFPDDIDFEVGRSDPARDWCAFHSVVVNDEGQAYSPSWDVRFDMNEKPAGRATLRLGVAGVRGDRLRKTDPNQCGVEVFVNGQSVGRRDYENDSAPTRSATRGRYRESEFIFDADLLHPGTNTVTLTLRPVRTQITRSGYGDVPSGILMYDALRLELDENLDDTEPSP